MSFTKNSGTILNTPLVQIFEENDEYKVLIKMSGGGILEHEPFPKNLQGLIGALQMATECLAGKFYPKRVLTGYGTHKNDVIKYLKPGQTHARQALENGGDDEQ